ncbi:MAG: T9SS type A sorting domain-containing protein [Bacteroidia bacterium]
MGWQKIQILQLRLDDDYDQLWVHCPSGSLNLDDLELYKSCCNLNSTHTDQNIVDPPSRYVGDYIHAGENVISNITAGPVIITHNVDSVVYQAGNSIELFPGFSVEEGANFVGRIKYCNKAPLTVYIDSMAVENPTCSTKYSASACGGSGEYSFSWSNNIGDANKPERTELLSFENNQTITVTVTDLITHETDTRSIFRVKSPFYGDFSFSEYPGDLITPNGDNYNDYFMLVDSARLGENNFGYNAYGYKLILQDRWNASWNGLWYSGYVEDTINGFSFDELNPPYNYCSENVNHYKWEVRFYNCKGDQYWFGTFDEVGCGTFPNDETSTSFETNNEIEISPNPFLSILQIDNIAEPTVLKIETLNGQLVHTQKLRKGSNSIDLSFLVSGVYSVTIYNNSGQVLKRAKVVKL